MKHIAMIQSEFLKEAREWDDMSLEDQKGYLKRHPKSKRKLTAKPDKKKNVKDKLDAKKTKTKEKEKVKAITGGIDRVIKRLEKRVTKDKKQLKKETDQNEKESLKDMIEMYEGDISDAETIKSRIKSGDFSGAHNKLRMLDTAAREEFPASLFNFLEKANK